VREVVDSERGPGLGASLDIPPSKIPHFPARGYSNIFAAAAVRKKKKKEKKEKVI
jgi:hypothetical protein